MLADVELLRTGSQLESTDQCFADLVDAGVVAAQWARAIEVEYSVWRQVLQCRGQISCREGVVGTAKSLDIGVLWHACLLHQRARGTFPHQAVRSKWAPLLPRRLVGYPNVPVVGRHIRRTGRLLGAVTTLIWGQFRELTSLQVARGRTSHTVDVWRDGPPSAHLLMHHWLGLNWLTVQMPRGSPSVGHVIIGNELGISCVWYSWGKLGCNQHSHRDKEGDVRRGNGEPVPPEAVEALCRKEWPRLVGLLTLLVGEPFTAEELAQEVLIRICQDPDRILAMVAPGAWMHRVAVNLANSHFRRLNAGRKAHQRLTLERLSDRPPSPTDGVAVRQALQALPLRQRSAIVLRYYADLPIRDIAATLSCPEGTVKTLIHDAIEALRRGGLVQDT
jgi:RNA polymerase sigma-70 factor (ECF subfamily)